MADIQAATLTQLRNIQVRTGQSIAALHAALAASGLARHGDKRSWLMEQYKLGYGDANTVVHLQGQVITGLDGGAPVALAAAEGDPLDSLYTGAKAHLRPLHEAVMAAVAGFGDFEQAPKKSYVSLRRKKQFAMLGPATKDLIEVGLNVRDLPPHPRLKAMPPGGMCAYTVRLGTAAEVDKTLIGWLRQAFDGA